MNKSDLSNVIAEKAGLTKKDAANALDAAIEAITASLVAGESVQLIGFGTFEVRDRAARSGKNPLTGEVIEIAATRVPAFKAGKALKSKIG